MKIEPKPLSKEACQARVISNWEYFQHAFVGKTDQEVRAIADQCFKTADEVHKVCPTREFPTLQYHWNHITVGYGELDALKFAFAAEEELRRRGSNL